MLQMLTHLKVSVQKTKRSRLNPTLVGWNEWTMVYRPPPYQRNEPFGLGLFALP